MTKKVVSRNTDAKDIWLIAPVLSVVIPKNPSTLLIFEPKTEITFQLMNKPTKINTSFNLEFNKSRVNNTSDAKLPNPRETMTAKRPTFKGS